MQDLGLRIEDLGFRVEDLRILGSSFRVEDFGFRIPDLGTTTFKNDMEKKMKDETGLVSCFLFVNVYSVFQEYGSVYI